MVFWDEWQGQTGILVCVFFFGTRRRVDRQIFTEVSQKLAAKIGRDYEDVRISYLGNYVLPTFAEHVAEF